MTTQLMQRRKGSKDLVLFSAQRPITKLLKLVTFCIFEYIGIVDSARCVHLHIRDRTHVTHMENRETMGIVDPTLSCLNESEMPHLN